MPRPLPSVDNLRRLLTYNPATGGLTWLPRTPDMFAGKSKQARRKSCACWNGRFAGKPALIGIDLNGYYQGPVMGRYLKAHRVAWALRYGKWPSERINHRNGDHRDNRIANLRDVDHRSCHRNAKRSSRNRSGITGVLWNARLQRWQATIGHNGKSLCLGTFRSADDAAAARKAAEIELGFDPSHGEPRDFANHFVPRRNRSPL